MPYEPPPNAFDVVGIAVDIYGGLYLDRIKAVYTTAGVELFGLNGAWDNGRFASRENVGLDLEQARAIFLRKQQAHIDDLERDLAKAKFALRNAIQRNWRDPDRG